MQIAKLDVAIVSEGSNISIRICEPFYLFVYVCLFYIEYFVGLLFFSFKATISIEKNVPFASLFFPCNKNTPHEFQ